MSDEGRQLLAGGLGDYRLVSFEWLQDGNDLQVAFAPPGKNEERVRLRFIWATRVRVAMDFGEYACLPLLFESEVRRLNGQSGWRVTLSFDGVPEGELTLECDEVRLVPR